MPVKIAVPAKVNLWLEVIRKRSDGYHDLSSLMLPIGVHDQLELRPAKSQIRVWCTHPQIPEGPGNLAWRAAESYLKQAGLEQGVRIRLTKRIPVAAGLGGGSADAAAVLLGMNRLFSHHFSMTELHDLAHRLGADVPFFLYRQPALATGIGEKLEPVEGVPEYPLVLIKPRLTVSTRWVFQRLALTRGESRIKIDAFMAHPWRLHEVMENDLEAVTFCKRPLLAHIKAWLVEQGALGALMSGSGPTVFGVFPDMSHAERVGAQAHQVWDKCWIMTTKVRSSPDLDQL